MHGSSTLANFAVTSFCRVPVSLCTHFAVSLFCQFLCLNLNGSNFDLILPCSHFAVYSFRRVLILPIPLFEFKDSNFAWFEYFG